MFVILTLFSVITKEAQAQRYYIIVSSSTTKIKAVEHLEKLRATGFTDSGMLYFDEARSYRVYFSSYESEEKAIQIKNKYQSKFEGAWIYTSLENNGDIAIKTENIELTDLSESININQDKIQQINKRTYSLERQVNILKSEVRELKNMQDSVRLLNDKISALYDYLTIVEQNSNATTERFNSLEESILENKNQYLSKSDTANYARQTVRSDFDFGDPAFAVSAGVVLAHILSEPNQFLENYLGVDAESFNLNFYGINYGFDYYLKRKLSIGLEMSAFYYLNSSNDFLFPEINIKYCHQVKTSPLKINPKIGIGTDVLMGKNFAFNAANYLILSPSIELEYGINKSFSILGKATYSNNLSLNSNTHSNFQHANFSLGIRYNYQRQVKEAVDF